MANWEDIASLLVTVTIVGGVIYGILFIMKQISQGVESTKEKLKDRGLTISDKGVSVKTSKRFDREDYVDATQRGLVKAMNAASFGNPEKNHSSTSLTPSAPGVERVSSSSSTSSEKKKSSIFGRKKKE